MKRFEFAEKIKKFTDAPLALGDKTKGWDCLNILDEFYRSIGKDFPTEYKGINESNYIEKWNSGNVGNLYLEFLLTLGESVNPNYAIEGDLFIFKGREVAFPAIYLGRGNLQIVCEKGVRVVTMKVMKALYGLPIDVRRL